MLTKSLEFAGNKKKVVHSMFGFSICCKDEVLPLWVSREYIDTMALTQATSRSIIPIIHKLFDNL